MLKDRIISTDTSQSGTRIFGLVDECAGCQHPLGSNAQAATGINGRDVYSTLWTLRKFTERYIK